MTLEDIARTHWWHRNKHRFDDEFLHVLEGHSSPAIEQAWDEARTVETAAMKAALGSVTLLDTWGCSG